MGKKINIITDEVGKKYGRLTVTGDAGRDSKGRPCAYCDCDCGNKTVVSVVYLRHGDTKSCGCLREQVLAHRNVVHGLCGTTLYRTWKNINRRCFNKRSADYPDYGGRGVTMHKSWRHDAAAFVSYMESVGWEYGLQVDRIDNDGDYEPGNVRCVKNIFNANNKRLIRSDNKTGFRGVHGAKGKFIASLNFKGIIKKSYYGFKTARSAAIYRDKKCVELGILTPLNFPREKVLTWLK